MGGYMQWSMEVELQGEFAVQPENVSQSCLKQGQGSNFICCEQLLIFNVELRMEESDIATSSLSPAIALVQQATEHGLPANVITLIHTESNPITGSLFYGSREQDAVYSTLPDLLDAFVGGETKVVMVDGKAKALQVPRPV